MAEVIQVDICIIGAGSGGLTLAAGAVQMGASVVLIEKGAMGGDCLNTGCVPSKALLAAAEKAAHIKDAAAFGVHAGKLAIDYAAVHQHVQSVIASIAPNDSVARFESLGVRVIRATARFIDKQNIQAGDVTVHAKYTVIATGSSPFVPPIEGLQGIPFFTNENIFDQQTAISHLIVIGGGPIGMELAQASRRLGAEVTVMEAARLLVKDDPDATAVVIEYLRKEGIRFYEGGRNIRFEALPSGDIQVFCEMDSTTQCVTGSHVLIATGRRANVHGLALEKAGVEYTERGISVNQSLRTSNARIFAIGDVVGPYQFTHMAAYQAGIVLRNILFKWPVKVHYKAVPWVTYTDPELAHVGLAASDAKKQNIKHRVLHWSFAENDRAQAERRTEGLVKVIVRPNGRILGASIVGLHAGELIQPWVLAINQRLKIGAMAAAIAPYPTLGEVNKRIAGSFYTKKIFSDRMRSVVGFLMRYTRFK
ncbi:MAG: FAD-dependent oxidoreductase [Mariprofundaceae bacterium]|nr:FAD-dependent oxidoreductase [Mariprofundaceae bacterium]